MTGEVFTIQTVEFQNGPYTEDHIAAEGVRNRISAVKLSDRYPVFADPYKGRIRKSVGHPDTFLSTFSSILLSFDFCEGFPVSRNQPVVLSSYPATFGQHFLHVEAGNGQVNVVAMNGTVASNRVTAVFTYPQENPLSVLTNILVSVDFGAETIWAYARDVPCAISSITWGGNPGGLSLSIYHHWFISGLHGAPLPQIVRFWGRSTILTTEVFDLSIVENRRQFVDSAGVPAEMGDNGTVFLTGAGGPMTVYADEFHYARDVANDFAINHGGGLIDWEILGGPLEFDMEACYAP